MERSGVIDHQSGIKQVHQSRSSRKYFPHNTTHALLLSLNSLPALSQELRKIAPTAGNGCSCSLHQGNNVSPL
jgi:hypothetical protein